MTNTKQLNAFEIKREIARLVKALEKSTILIDTSEFNTLDQQDDKAGVVKILMKEFHLCNEDAMPVIKLLLLRYADVEELLTELESIIKNPKNANNIKLHAIELISSFKPDWHEENYDSYLEYDEELIQQETKELLEHSKDNPEIQLDFLDFFSAIPKKDQLVLLDSLKEDQQGLDFANILVPIFLSFPKDEIGLHALKLLSNTKSSFAYEALSQVYDYLDETTQQYVRKSLSELKLSGAASRHENSNSHEGALFFMIPPDGEGNLSLLYQKPNKDTVQLIGIVIDDYTGIRECLGFSSISEFEASFLMEKLSGTDFKTTIKPEIFKQILNDAEKLNYRKSAPPYEYNCWKKVFLDIQPEQEKIEDILKEHYKNTVVTPDDIKEVLNSDFTVPWFYNRTFGDETETFFDELDSLIKNNPVGKVDFAGFIKQHIDNVFYPQEKENWCSRLLLTAYGKYSANEDKAAGVLYKIARDKQATEELFTFILKQSIFQYFLNMLQDKVFLKYKQKELEEILSYLEELWGFYV